MGVLGASSFLCSEVGVCLFILWKRLGDLLKELACKHCSILRRKLQRVEHVCSQAFMALSLRRSFSRQYEPHIAALCGHPKDNALNFKGCIFLPLVFNFSQAGWSDCGARHYERWSPTFAVLVFLGICLFFGGFAFLGLEKRWQS